MYLHPLQSILDALIQQRCWSVIAGEGTGSHVSLQFGEKRRMRIPIRNPLLSEIERTHEGEFSVFLKMCGWRLDGLNSVICASTSSNEAGGPMLSGLHHLIGEKIIRAQAMHPGKDMELLFSGDFCLRVFCDQTEDGYDNYSLRHSGDSIVAVGPKGVIQVERDD